MPVPSSITDLSTTASANFPDGAQAPSVLDDVQRAHGSFIAQLRTGAVATTANVTAGTIDGATVGATTPSTGKFTTLQATSGINSTAIGATTPSTGAFTTLSASNSANSLTPVVTATNANAGTGAGAVYSASNGTNGGWFGALGTAYTTYGSLQANRVGIYTNQSIFLASDNPSGHVYVAANSGVTPVADFSSAGLAVTGALSATGRADFGTGTGTTAGLAVVLGSAGMGSGYGALYSQSVSPSATNYSIGVRFDSSALHLNATTQGFLKVSDSPIANWTSTGLAVTGALSATGQTASGSTGTDGKYTLNRTSDGAAAVSLGLSGNDFSANNGAAGGYLFKISNVTQLALDASGNLGLGVTPSAWQSGTNAIEANGVSIWARGTNGGEFVTNAYFNGTNWIYKANAAASRYIQQLGAHGWQTASSGTSGTAITFTQSLAVGKGTSLALEGATSTAGTGIEFPATQLASSSANCLDDYEEGFWTPALTCVTSGTITLTTPTNSMNYVKVGKMVYVNGSITVSSVASPVGDLRIDGLPFTVNNSAAGDSAVAIYGSSVLNTSAHTQIQSIAAKNSTNIYVRGYNNGSLVATFSNNIQAGTVLYINGSYPI